MQNLEETNWEELYARFGRVVTWTLGLKRWMWEAKGSRLGVDMERVDEVTKLEHSSNYEEDEGKLEAEAEKLL